MHNQNTEKAVENDLKSKPLPFYRSMWSNRKTFIVALSIIAVILGLSVGLGVGLTRHRDHASPTSGAEITSENSTAQVQTAAYWTPSNGTTWQIELDHSLSDTSPDVEVFDLDLFENSAATIANLRGRGKKVICYFSAGSYEEWRPDAHDFKNDTDLGNPLDGWPGERWLNVNSPNVRNIMLERLDLAKNKSCDGVDPDNVDAFDNENTGVDVNILDSVNYVRFLADSAHSLNLSVGLKNSLSIIPQTIEYMQWAVSEQCVEQHECQSYRDFIEGNKPVFSIEYPDSAPNLTREIINSFCNDKEARGFSTVLKKMDLDDWYYACPRIRAVSRLPYIKAIFSGKFVQGLVHLHATYGPVVRIAPDELSFISSTALLDIYGHQIGRPAFPKSPFLQRNQPNGYPSILNANDADHSRFRRLLSHAFSENALRQQEPLLQSYVDLLIAKLRNQIATSTTSTAKLDLVKWFNFVTFDISGDLSFGDSFHSLEESQYHPWVAILLSLFKAAFLMISTKFYPPIETALMYLIPQRIKQERVNHFEFTKSKVHQRLQLGEAGQGKSDFMTYVLRHNDEKGMSVPEIEATFSILVAAGSETTATALSGMMNYLLKDAERMRFLVNEIRAAFAHPSAITIDSVSKLAYLGAVIDEGLRLCQPVPFGATRAVPKGGASVDGHWLPQGIIVSVPRYVASRDPSNIADEPNAFKPERWLSSEEGQDKFPPKQRETTLSFAPFSLGSRNCIGRNLANLEMRLIMAKMLWSFDIWEDEGQGFAWESQDNYGLWEKKPLEVWIRERQG
ncbi:MAG: hypothetical protein Q9167_006760 [Letrouitia subvulpina]